MRIPFSLLPMAQGWVTRQRKILPKPIKVTFFWRFKKRVPWKRGTWAGLEGRTVEREGFRQWWQTCRGQRVNLLALILLHHPLQFGSLKVNSKSKSIRAHSKGCKIKAFVRVTIDKRKYIVASSPSSVIIVLTFSLLSELLDFFVNLIGNVYFYFPIPTTEGGAHKPFMQLFFFFNPIELGEFLSSFQFS